MTTNQKSAMDTLLDGTLDDLADKPAFKPFPVGAHRCKFTWEPKTIKDTGSGIQINLVVIKTEELANPEEEPAKPGDKTNLMFFFSHAQEFVWQFGQGQFKELMAGIAEKLGAGSPRELMAKSNGMEALILTGIRSNKDKTQEFTSIEGFELLA
jgi:hypothetical protein